jgi:hypothetical protein
MSNESNRRWIESRHSSFASIDVFVIERVADTVYSCTAHALTI